MSREVDSSPGGTEVLQNEVAVDVILARHAAYYTADGVPSTELGGLTPDGQIQAQQLGRHIFQQVVKTNRPTDVLFINSPTAYEDDRGQLYGRRAEQTGYVAAMTILELAQALPADHLRLLGPLPPERPQRPYHVRLAEPYIHYITAARHPTAYYEEQIEKFGREPDQSTATLGRKEGYARGDAEVDAVGRHIGAETALEVGQRAYTVVEDMWQLAKLHKAQFADRDFMVVLVTHDDVIRSIVQNAMGAGANAYGYFPDHVQTLTIHLENDQAQLEFRGHVYNRDIQT